MADRGHHHRPDTGRLPHSPRLLLRGGAPELTGVRRLMPQEETRWRVARGRVAEPGSCQNGSPMVDHAHERATIGASPERLWAVATDFARYPVWAHDLKEARVVQRDDQGRATRVAFRAAAMGRSTRYTLAYDYAGAPDRLSWELAEGDIMRRLDGSYLFTPVDDDPDSTDVLYELVVELIIPLPGFVKRRAESKIIHTALRELKDFVETGEAGEAAGAGDVAGAGDAAESSA
ncbi:MAG: SRPBCC family protein [Acidimicrobiales bacterium]